MQSDDGLSAMTEVTEVN